MYTCAPRYYCSFVFFWLNYSGIVAAKANNLKHAARHFMQSVLSKIIEIATQKTLAQNTFNLKHLMRNKMLLSGGNTQCFILK